MAANELVAFFYKFQPLLLNKIVDYLHSVFGTTSLIIDAASIKRENGSLRVTVQFYFSLKSIFKFYEFQSRKHLLFGLLQG